MLCRLSPTINSDGSEMQEPVANLYLLRACYLNSNSRKVTSSQFSQLFFIYSNTLTAEGPEESGMESQEPRDIKPNLSSPGGDAPVTAEDFHVGPILSSELVDPNEGLNLLASVAEFVSAEEMEEAILSLDDRSDKRSRVRKYSDSLYEATPCESSSKKRSKPSRRLRLSQGSPQSSDVSVSNISTSGSSIGERKCGKCRNHGLDVGLRGHNKDCPFLNCLCHLCSLKDMQRDVVTLQARLRRGYKGRGRGRNHGSIQIVRPVAIRSGEGDADGSDDEEVDNVAFILEGRESAEAVKGLAAEPSQVIDMTGDYKVELEVEGDDYRIDAN